MPGPKDGPKDFENLVKADSAYKDFDKALLSGKDLSASEALRNFLTDEMAAGKTLKQAEDDFQNRIKNDQNIQNLLPNLHIDFENDSSTSYKAVLSLHDSFSATDITMKANVASQGGESVSEKIIFKGVNRTVTEQSVSSSH
jgi:hypothetical protein